jgi:hypothetical protein
MLRHTPLVATVVVGIALAFALGVAAHRLGVLLLLFAVGMHFPVVRCLEPDAGQSADRSVAWDRLRSRRGGPRSWRWTISEISTPARASVTSEPSRSATTPWPSISTSPSERLAKPSRTTTGNTSNPFVTARRFIGPPPSASKWTAGGGGGVSDDGFDALHATSVLSVLHGPRDR